MLEGVLMLGMDVVGMDECWFLASGGFCVVLGVFLKLLDELGLERHNPNYCL
jgi:hypothetical protein